MPTKTAVIACQTVTILLILALLTHLSPNKLSIWKLPVRYYRHNPNFSDMMHSLRRSRVEFSAGACCAEQWVAGRHMLFANDYS